jgi:hypothetical protein
MIPLAFDRLTKRYGAVTAVDGLSAGMAAAILLAGQQGTPPLGSEPNLTKTLSIAALSSMVMLVLGILATAGEFRHRTIKWTFLAEPRRGRVLAAKLAVLGAVGAAMGALAFGLALAIACPGTRPRGLVCCRCPCRPCGPARPWPVPATGCSASPSAR